MIDGDEQSWHPDGADLPWWGVILLALLMVLPAALAFWMIGAVL